MARGAMSPVLAIQLGRLGQPHHSFAILPGLDRMMSLDSCSNSFLSASIASCHL